MGNRGTTWENETERNGMEQLPFDRLPPKLKDFSSYVIQRTVQVPFHTKKTFCIRNLSVLKTISNNFLSSVQYFYSIIFK